MSARLPRIAFVGTGWIGLNRMQAMLATEAIEPAIVVEPSAEMAAKALETAPCARVVASLDEALAERPDGVVVASPSALHADQALQALEAGAAVFCQKPLGRSAPETARVIEAARAADRLLAVDFSYRFTEGLRRLRDIVREGGIGRVFALDLTFHNAYGPDKPWFYDPALSGGGCVMDLGIHLVDLAGWLTGERPDPTSVASRLYAGGEPLRDPSRSAEDYAVASFALEGGATVRLACSWRLHAGRDAVIAVEIHGREGGLSFRNVSGSFYDFTAERYRGTASEPLVGPPDAWGGRAAADWARRLAAGERYDPGAEDALRAAEIVDAIYRRGLGPG